MPDMIITHLFGKVHLLYFPFLKGRVTISQGLCDLKPIFGLVAFRRRSTTTTTWSEHTASTSQMIWTSSTCICLSSPTKGKWNASMSADCKAQTKLLLSWQIVALIHRNGRIILTEVCFWQSEGSGDWEADPWRHLQNPQVSPRHSNRSVKLNRTSLQCGFDTYSSFVFAGALRCWWLATPLLLWRPWWVEAQSLPFKNKPPMLMTVSHHH